MAHTEKTEDLTPAALVAASPVVVTVTAKPGKGAQTKAETTLDGGTGLEDCRVIVAVVGADQIGDIPAAAIVADIPGAHKLAITVDEKAAA